MNFRKPVKVKFLDHAAKEYEQLEKIVNDEIKRDIRNSRNQQLLKSIKRAVELLKENTMYGIQIKKNLIPKKFPVANLWKINLTGYWRMLYTIRGTELEIICFVLEILDHKSYNKLFGYRKK